MKKRQAAPAPVPSSRFPWGGAGADRPSTTGVRAGRVTPPPGHLAHLPVPLVLVVHVPSGIPFVVAAQVLHLVFEELTLVVHGLDNADCSVPGSGNPAKAGDGQVPLAYMVRVTRPIRGT